MAGGGGAEVGATVLLGTGVTLSQVASSVGHNPELAIIDRLHPC
jgi:hypothetical protein